MLGRASVRWPGGTQRKAILEDMTDPFWTTLTASLLSATAALSGVALTNQHALRRHQAELQEKLRGQQREIVSEIVLAGREWANYQQMWIPMVSQMVEKDFLEFAQTDTSKAMGEVLTRLNVACVKADLFVPAGLVKDQIAWLAEFVQTFPQKVTGPIMEKPKDPEVVATGLHELVMFRSELHVMSRNASARLGVRESPVTSPPSMGQRIREAWRVITAGNTKLPQEEREEAPAAPGGGV